jgi:hypothetical protein
MRQVIVYHSTYGCETGCCGHVVEVYENYKETGHTFAFDHPNMNETPAEFAKRLVTEEFSADHVADLDWDNMVINEF